MLAAILVATAGVAVAAAVIDGFNDDDSDDTSSDNPMTPPVAEDGLTVFTEDGEPEQIDPETLDESYGTKIFEGTEEDEAVYIDPNTTSEFNILLGSGGADTVITGLGQSVDTADEDTDGDGDTADIVRLIYTPGQPAEVFVSSSVRGEYSMDTEDTLTLEFPENATGSILPVYHQEHYQPGDSCCSGGHQHSLTLVYVPERLEYTEEDISGTRSNPVYYPDWEELGMVPLVDLNLGNEGNSDYTHEGGERREWDYVIDPPILNSELPFNTQIRIIVS